MLKFAKIISRKMQIKNLNTYFFIILMLCLGILSYLVFRPFFVAIFIAAIFAVLFNPFYKKMLKISKNNTTISSGLACLLVFFVIVLPFSFIISLITSEIISFSQIALDPESNIYPQITPILEEISQIPFIDNFIQDPKQLLSDERITNAASQIGQFSLKYASSFSQSIASTLGMIVVMFFSLFYFFIDGKQIIQKTMSISPLANKYEEIIIKKFTSISRATIKGTLALGLIQGLMGGFAFLVTGVPSVTLWTILMIFLSIIPLVGAPVILFPASIIMLLTGNIWQAIFLVIATIIVSGADNILRPKLVGKDIQMHPLLIFFATIGGISAFGIFGFIIGPVVIALFLTFIDIYELEFKSDLKKYNAK